MAGSLRTHVDAHVNTSSFSGVERDTDTKHSRTSIKSHPKDVAEYLTRVFYKDIHSPKRPITSCAFCVLIQSLQLLSHC